MNHVSKVNYLFVIILLSCINIQAQVTNADIQVAYTYRLTEYIEWQNQSVNDKFVIGVFSDDETMLNKFEHLAKKRKIKNRDIEIVPIVDIMQLKEENLNILYINKERNSKITNILSGVKNKQVLLISNRCTTRDAVMLNFLPSEKEGAIKFEINKKNTEQQNLVVHPDILLLGGSYIDVRDVFYKQEQELEFKKQKLEESKRKINRQYEVIKKQDLAIGSKELQIAEQSNQILLQADSLYKQKETLRFLANEIKQQQMALNKKHDTLSIQQLQIATQKENISKTQQQLRKQKSKLIKQAEQINKQEYVLIEQLTELKQQRIILVISFSLVILALVLVYVIFRSFRIKKNANIKLKDYNDEILAQNEEIRAQREELMEAQDKLEANNQELERLSVVASQTNNAVLLIDKHNKIEWVNKGFTKLFGFTLNELSKEFGENSLSSGSRVEIKKKIEQTRKTKQTVEYLTENTAKSGAKLWMHTTLTPIVNDKDEVHKIIVIEANVTELKQAEQNIVKQKIEIEKQHNLLEGQKKELEKYQNHLENLVKERTQQLILAKEKAEESDRMKSSFISNMSHEIRTPMNAVVGFSSLLGSKDNTPEMVDEYVGLINSNADALVRLIDDIIDLSRIEAGKLNIQKEICDVNSILNELFITYENKIKIENRNINLQLINNNEFPKLSLLTDKIRLNQVLSNLLDNALKFTENGVVKFGYLLSSNKGIQFYVSDTGIGISKEKQKLVFERFLKIEDDNQKLYRGTGLGLAICKSIVTDLGGTIDVKSKPNEGSKFFFTLPLNKNE